MTAVSGGRMRAGLQLLGSAARRYVPYSPVGRARPAGGIGSAEHFLPAAGVYLHRRHVEDQREDDHHHEHDREEPGPHDDVENHRSIDQPLRP